MATHSCTTVEKKEEEEEEEEEEKTNLSSINNIPKPRLPITIRDIPRMKIALPIPIPAIRLFVLKIASGNRRSPDTKLASDIKRTDIFPSLIHQFDIQHRQEPAHRTRRIHLGIRYPGPYATDLGHTPDLRERRIGR